MYYPPYTSPSTVPYDTNPNYIGDPLPPNDPNYFTVPNYNNWEPWITQPVQTKQVKKTTTTLEKYNAKGKLISKEVTIVEEEIIDVPIWTTDTITTTDTTNPYTAIGQDPITTTFDDPNQWTNDNINDIASWTAQAGDFNSIDNNISFGPNDGQPQNLFFGSNMKIA